jgi:hypothetical protein
MSIFNNLKKVRAAIAVASITSDVSDISIAINKAAMAAMFKGMGTNEWGDYMAIFCENQDQLTRLTVQANGEAPYLQQMRAYLVADGICDPSTTFSTMHVGDGIDKNPPVPDAPNDLGDTIKNRRPDGLKDILK